MKDTEAFLNLNEEITFSAPTRTSTTSRAAIRNTLWNITQDNPRFLSGYPGHRLPRVNICNESTTRVPGNRGKKRDFQGKVMKSLETFSNFTL